MWVLIFLLVTTAFALLLQGFVQPAVTPAGRRLQQLALERGVRLGVARRGAAQPNAAPADAPRLSVKERVVSLVDRLTSGLRFTDRLSVRLQRANWRWRPAEFLMAQAAAAVAGLVFTVVAMPGFWWLLPPLAAAIPLAMLSRSEAARLKAFEQQLPDALTMTANSLRSGYSFMQAMDVVSREMPEPISREFAIVLRETRLNVPLDAALGNLVQRVKSEDLDLVVTAILIQRQVGGNLAELLDKISTTIKERLRLHGEVRTLTTQGRLSGWIVSLLPMILGLVLSAISPGYLDPMFSHPIGWAMLGIGTVMQLIGIMTIQRMVKLEV